MKLKNLTVLILSYLFVGFIGFSIGIYSLPILTAPASPTLNEIAIKSKSPLFVTSFSKNRKDSDLLHWGEGDLVITKQFITFTGKLAPGPNYKLYLSKSFVETEVDFNRLKPEMVVVDDIMTFDNFIAQVPGDIDSSKFNTLIVWCESFGQFITSAKYQ